MSDTDLLSKLAALESKLASVEAAANRTGLLDADGVASLLNCSARHVYRLCDSGRLPRPIQLGALRRWSRSELEAWIAERCQPRCRRTRI